MPLIRQKSRGGRPADGFPPRLRKGLLKLRAVGFVPSRSLNKAFPVNQTARLTPAAGGHGFQTRLIYSPRRQRRARVLSSGSYDGTESDGPFKKNRF